MAKTIAQIEAEIIAAKNADANLASLNSPSLTAAWRLWIYLVAVGHRIIYEQWDVTKNELSNIAAQQIIGTCAWYVGLAYDWNDPISGTNVIGRASCRENGTKVFLKVARYSGGVTTHLTPAQLGAFRGDMLLNKVAGTDLTIFSQIADKVKTTLTIRHDGTLTNAIITTAIRGYLQGLAFDSTLSKSLLINFLIEDVAGVLDASVDSLEVNDGLGYSVIATNTIEADSGYWELDTVTTNFIV